MEAFATAALSPVTLLTPVIHGTKDQLMLINAPGREVAKGIAGVQLIA